MNPRYPVFVPTKGRAKRRYTIRALEKIGVPYTAVVEPQEYDEYARVVDPANLLILPFRDRGLVPTRNWIWDHCAEKGYRRFWTMDDNIRGFFRLNHNLKTPVSSGTMLYAIEDFVERYENVPIAGCNYYMFAPRKAQIPAYYLNTRVYSNMLIDTFAARPTTGEPYRNRGFYNDDTDLCLQVLDDGWCTVLFNAFLVDKIVTMTHGGGMTEHYLGDGRRKMAEEIAERWPEIAKVTVKFGRWQHQVDYSGFAKNRLRRRPGLEISDEPNNFGMRLELRVDDEWVPIEHPDPERYRIRQLKKAAGR